MLDIQNFIGESSTEADRKRMYRAKIEAEKSGVKLIGQKSDKCPDKNPPELEIELELELEKKKDIMSSKSNSIPYSKIIDYLNEKTNKRYKVTQKWKDLIKARWNEGQREDDFKKVVDVKTKQWIESSEMNKYLRPQTLFGNKFDEYLNEYRPPITSTRLNEVEETQRRLREVYGDDYQNE